MRANPADYDLVSPGSLPAVLTLLAQQPGQYTPIAGGTELMVQFAAGRLAARKLVNIYGLPELTAITITPDEITIGAGVTYTTLRNHPELSAALPLLTRAASWTGSIANQNRGTLGGNLVNGSPAADSPPALLAYNAELSLISARGARRLPYAAFHTAYKQTALAPDELVLSVHVPAIQLPRPAYTHQYLRKVGPRNAMAISKVALAAVANVSGGLITQVRIGLASVSHSPFRCLQTEAALANSPLGADTIARARAALIAEIAPLDDIRSTAKYRTHVAANLLEEFLHELATTGTQRSGTLLVDPGRVPQVPTVSSSTLGWGAPGSGTLLVDPRRVPQVPTVSSSTLGWGAPGSGTLLVDPGRVPQVPTVSSSTLGWGAPGSGTLLVDPGRVPQVPTVSSSTLGWGAPGSGTLIVDPGVTPLALFNAQPASEAIAQLLALCGSHHWAQTLAAQRPFHTPAELFAAAETIWFALPEPDWLEAFAHHPRIGENTPPTARGAPFMTQPHRGMSGFLAHSSAEQSAAQQTLDSEIGQALLDGNRLYEQRFGFRYLVFASGRTAPWLLAILNERLTHTRGEELQEAVRQQHRITALRMTKWLQPENP